MEIFRDLYKILDSFRVAAGLELCVLLWYDVILIDARGVVVWLDIGHPTGAQDRELLVDKIFSISSSVPIWGYYTWSPSVEWINIKIL